MREWLFRFTRAVPRDDQHLDARLMHLLRAYMPKERGYGVSISLGHSAELPIFVERPRYVRACKQLLLLSILRLQYSLGFVNLPCFSVPIQSLPHLRIGIVPLRQPLFLVFCVVSGATILITSHPSCASASSTLNKYEIATAVSMIYVHSCPTVNHILPITFCQSA